MRISATTLESFRLWRQPDQDWMTEESLIETIQGVFVPTRPILLGSAFGRILERPDRYRIDGGYQCGEFSFADDTMADALALVRQEGVFEAKAVKSYGGLDVVSKADQLVGAHLKELKTTTSTFDFTKYAESYQWRLMVDAFEPALVSYYVFCLDDHENGIAEVRDIHTFNLFPYAALHDDCDALVQAFAEYVTAKGLDGLLRQRQREAA